MDHRNTTYAVTKEPESTWEVCSREWVAAKTRLNNAQFALSNAQSELDEARQVEIQAWSALEATADRGPQTVTSGGPALAFKR